MSRIFSALFFLLIVLTQSSASFRCPDRTEACNCNQYIENSFHIVCRTSRGTHDVTIKPRIDKIAVSINCMNSPSWSDFYLGNESLDSLPLELRFEGCPPPRKDQRFNEQIDVSKVHILEFSNLKRPLTSEDLEEFNNTYILNLAKNNLGQVDPELLRGLPNLRKLNLQQTKIQIPKNFFLNAEKLVFLDLSRNSLKNLQANSFEGLESLETLNMWKSEINEIHPIVFHNMDSLVSLAIQNNNLKALPSGIFRSLRNLERLDISGNNFASLPSGLVQFSHNLQVFMMTNNKAKQAVLPSNFLANKPNLKNVNLQRSKLHNLPEDLFWNSTNLRELTLDRNFLKTLPENIFRDAGNLTSLSITFNEIAEFADNTFANCKNLKKLDLSYNKINYIGENTLTGLVSLAELKVENNGLTYIHMDAFRTIPNLQIVKLRYNDLTLSSGYVEEELGGISPFHHCKHIKQIDLSHNNIAEFFGDWMFISFEKIDLSYNLIERVSAEDFQFASLKVELDLTNNKIYEVNLNKLEQILHDNNFKGEVNVKLADNPLNCDCDIYGLLRYVNHWMHPNTSKSLHLDVMDLKCVRPSWYASSRVLEINFQDFKCLAVESRAPRIEDPCHLESPCDCYYKPFDRALFVDCNRRNLTHAPGIINPMNMSRVILDLEGNKLETIPGMNKGYEYVAVMNLANNNISKFKSDVVTPVLKELNLRNNRLTMLDQATIRALEKTDLKLSLDGNPWTCECNSNTRDFLALVHHKIQDLQSVSCGHDLNIKFGNMTVEELCPSNIVYYIVIIVVSLIGLVLCLLAALYYRFQRHIKIWLFSKNLCMCLVTEEELDKDKTYDAFISYSHKNRDFVIEEVVSRLEEESYKVCYHERDWLAGEWIPTQIERSVEESRRTIIVLSSDFIQSEWSMLEFAAAHKQALKDQRTRVIIILYGDIGPTDKLDLDLRAYLETNTYVKWDETWFWRKLRYAMPHASRMEGMNRKSARGRRNGCKKEVCEVQLEELRTDIYLRENNGNRVENKTLEEIEGDSCWSGGVKNNDRKRNERNHFVEMMNDNNFRISMEDTVMEEKNIENKFVNVEVGEKSCRFTESIFAIGKMIGRNLSASLSMYNAEDKISSTS